MEVITSHSNSKIKLVRSLQKSSERKRSGMFLVEGIRHVGEAVEAAGSGRDIEILALYYSPDRLQSEYGRHLIEATSDQGMDSYAVSEDVFRSLAEKDNPQGILAILRTPQINLADIDVQAFAWGVAIIRPQDPGNLGAIMRTIDAVGANGLIIIDGGCETWHPAAVRASMGTLFWHPAITTTFEIFSGWAKTHHYHVYGSSAHGSQDYLTIQRYHRPSILLLGSEREGLNDVHRSICEKVISLPMRGKSTSLNLAVAAGVLLYHMMDR
jgi:TrmH family RNA methyltransferase